MPLPLVPLLLLLTGGATLVAVGRHSEGSSDPALMFDPNFYNAMFVRDASGVLRFTKFGSDGVWRQLAGMSLVKQRSIAGGDEYLAQTGGATPNAQTAIQAWLKGRYSVEAVLWAGQGLDGRGIQHPWSFRVIPATIAQEAQDTAPGSMWAVLYSPLAQAGPSGATPIAAPGAPNGVPGAPIPVQTPLGTYNLPPAVQAWATPGGSGQAQGGFQGSPIPAPPPPADPVWGTIPTTMIPDLQRLLQSGNEAKLRAAAVDVSSGGYAKAADVLTTQADKLRAATPPPAPTVVPPAETTEPTRLLTAEIKDGWNPFDLAKYYTGDGNRWRELTELNGIGITANSQPYPWIVGQLLAFPASWNVGNKPPPPAVTAPRPPVSVAPPTPVAPPAPPPSASTPITPGWGPATHEQPPPGPWPPPSPPAPVQAPAQAVDDPPPEMLPADPGTGGAPPVMLPADPGAGGAPAEEASAPLDMTDGGTVIDGDTGNEVTVSGDDDNGDDEDDIGDDDADAGPMPVASLAQAGIGAPPPANAAQPNPKPRRHKKHKKHRR